MNRATADNQTAQSEEEGLEPTKEWVKDLIDEIIAEEFASPDLELHWLDEDEGDPGAELGSIDEQSRSKFCNYAVKHRKQRFNSVAREERDRKGRQAQLRRKAIEEPNDNTR
jgi:hypothetical protein